jgi:K+-sensing histidine kinase KdpD
VRFLAETISLERYKNEEQRQKYLSQLINETDRAACLIDQMLLSVRLRKNLIKADYSVFSVSDKIDDLIQRFSLRLADWKVSVDISSDYQISADYLMWERVHINLIENAIKHAGIGKSLAIKAVTTANNRLAISISDRGPGLAGISEDSETSLLWGDLPYKPERGGSGIGLYLVRQIMREHNGNFRAKLRKEKGLTMTTDWKIAEEKNNGR